MNVFEDLVEQFLTIDGQVFVCPQYDVAWDNSMKEGGSSPDFVVLNMRTDPREVVIVEVGTGAAVDVLLDRVVSRETRWYNPLKRKMIREGAIDETWRFRFLGFVRRANVDSAQKRFAESSDVKFFPLEDATFPWAYWKNRQENGLPR
jgi:hypothetical protein